MDKVSEPVLIGTLRLRRGEVTCVDTAGPRLVGGSGDGTLRLWRWARDVAWVESAEYPRAHRYGVTGVRFALSGILLASIGIDGAARIWSTSEALVVRRTLAAPDAAAARSLEWATSDRLVVGHDDGGIRVWAVRSGTLLAHIRAHEGAVYALTALDNVALLLTACTEGVLKVFDFEVTDIITQGREGTTGPSPLLWEDGAHDLGVLCATQHLKRAATGGHDGRVRLWRVEGTGRERNVVADIILTGHIAAVTALHWARDLLASASLDRTARLWAPNSATCVRVLHAHSRYLTCVALASDMRYVVTGSNDKSIRMWSLGDLSVHDALSPPCNPLVHFALGDLEGIGPVEDDIATDIEQVGNHLECAGSAARCAIREPHASAINSIAISTQMIATACSDGYVRVFRYHEHDEVLQQELELSANSYPVMAVDFGANGALLLSGGLDGCARVWDVQTGCELMVMSVESCGSDGGGGVRDARISPHRPPLLLVASDDGLAALWSIDPPGPDPLHVYSGLAEAAICCAWSTDGRVLATGGEAGELRVSVPPPQSALLCQKVDAHDLGVLSCDFANTSSLKNFKSDDEHPLLLLATGGRDAFVKLWWVEMSVNLMSIEEGSLELAHTLSAHGGAVQCVRWGPYIRHESELTLATGGADRWARVWRVTVHNMKLDAQAVVAVPAGAAGGAPAVRLMGDGDEASLVVGSLSGNLAVWRLPPIDSLHDTESAETRIWGTVGVTRWLREYVLKPPGSSVPESEAARLLAAAGAAAVTGAKLLDEPLDELKLSFGYGPESGEELNELAETRERLLDEILWLRREPLSYELEDSAPHALRCPLTHAVLREPARASDGFTYERQNILDWILAAGTEEVRSPVSGRRLSSVLIEPNYGVRSQLQQFWDWRR
ncbi:WD repeat, SAM and U-box domain-containing protein 1-like [Vanessa tameamea]|uniref:WD repeat, SAM and U-box domain-containing protein 1-like n=1 Tax=Vanessa tameamea TaxID=334116 RepID=A0ABM4AP60_VANTA